MDKDKLELNRICKIAQIFFELLVLTSISKAKIISPVRDPNLNLKSKSQGYPHVKGGQSMYNFGEIAFHKKVNISLFQ
jgi:hypothetical protein